MSRFVADESVYKLIINRCWVTDNDSTVGYTNGINIKNVVHEIAFLSDIIFCFITY